MTRQQALTQLQIARQRHQEAQERAHTLEQQLHEARRQRQLALNANDDAAAARHNEQIGRLNTELRFSQSAIEECRQQVDVEQNRERRVRNAVANTSVEVDRLRREIAEHEARLTSLRPQLEEAQARHGEAQRQLVLLTPEGQP